MTPEIESHNVADHQSIVRQTKEKRKNTCHAPLNATLRFRSLFGGDGRRAKIFCTLASVKNRRIT